MVLPRWIDSLRLKALDLIYPSSCPLCEKPSDDPRTLPICASCWHGIKRYAGPFCGLCGRPFASEHGTLCGGCLKEPPPFRGALSYGIYEGALREAILQLKFSGVKRLAGPLGRLLSGIGLPDADLMVAVPSARGGLRARGFNQALLIGKVLSSETGIPLLRGFLYKCRETRPQVGLSAKERLINLKGAFSARGRLRGESVLLIDDVMTTGATASECSKSLLNAGAGEVFAATAARGG